MFNILFNFIFDSNLHSRCFQNYTSKLKFYDKYILENGRK